MNEALFQQLVASHRGYFLALAARYVGRADAEDVVQIALLNAWRRLWAFAGGEHDCLNWLSRIICNAAIDWKRHAALIHCTPLLDVDRWLDGDETPEEAALRAEERQEAHERVETMLRRCTVNQRRVLWWNYGMGVRDSALCPQLGMSLRQVKDWRHRGRLRCLRVDLLVPNALD